VNRVAKCVSFLLAIVLVGFISSCDSLSKVGSGLEGTIIFDVSYPYEAPTVMMDLYPKEMTVVFEKHKIHASLKNRSMV